MMKNIVIGLILPLFLAVSCVEKIVLDPMEEMPVVVNCVLMTERTAQELDLYYAKRPSETAYVPITDAKVVVRDASGNSYPFQWNGERWTSDFVPAYKTRYVLEIETRDGKKLSAETTVPDDYLLVPFPYFEKPKPTMLRQGFFQYRTFYFARPIGVSKFEPYSGELYAWITCGARLSTDHIDVDIFNLIPGKSWDLILHPYFDQVKVYYDTYIEKLPLYQGFLRIHQRDSFTGSVPESLLYDGRLGVEPSNLFILISDPELTELNEDGTPVMFKYRVRFVSPEYDRFLKDLITNKWIHEDELAQLYSMEPVYSNIAGGLGIFGAEVTRSTSFFGYLYHIAL